MDESLSENDANIFVLVFAAKTKGSVGEGPDAQLQLGCP